MQFYCRRESNGGKHGEDSGGVSYWIHTFETDGSRVSVSPGKGGARREKRKKDVQQSVAPLSLVVAQSVQEPNDDAHFRHEVFSKLLGRLNLLHEHKANLLRRGLPEEVIHQNEYRSIAKGVAHTEALKLFDEYGKRLFSVPGFHPGDDSAAVFRVFINGLLIPVRNLAGQIIALKLRKNKAGKGPRYLYVSGKGYDGVGPGTPCHIPRGITGPCETIRISEGELKADISYELSGVPTISVAGISNWRPSLPVVEELGAKTVWVAYDAETKPQTISNRNALCRALQRIGYTVLVETWDGSRGKGIDDFLAAHGGETQVTEFIDDQPERATIELDNRLQEEVTNEALRVAGRTGRVFQRGGVLVDMIRGVKQLKGSLVPDEAARIRIIPRPILKERFQSMAEWLSNGQPVDTPSWVVNTGALRGEWETIPPLRGIVGGPILRADGTILNRPGYDESTGLILESKWEYPDLPEKPTRDDAIGGLESLLDVVQDFPFAADHHLASWIAAVLTLVGRHAFAGPSPLFLIDANCPGTGKTKLGDVISIVANSREAARNVYPFQEEELRKKITALLMEGRSLILFDNVSTELGGPILEAVLTSTEWQDRRLGESENVSIPNTALWLATANNLILKDDTARRCIGIRIETPLEKPAERTDFVHPNLIEHCKKRHPQLVSGALSILSAYIEAGRPVQSLPAFGSFEGWSDLIRNAVVWVGLPDPCEGRTELNSRSDSDAGALGVFLDEFEKFDALGHGYTVAELVSELSHCDVPELRAALVGLVPTKNSQFPTTRQIGNRFAKFRHRIIDGKYLDIVGEFHKVARWGVKRQEV